MSDGRCNGIDDDGGGAGRAARRRCTGTPEGGEGEGRTLQIHFRPAATARHASERKLAVASERVSRFERRAAHARYALNTPAPGIYADLHKIINKCR